MIGIANTLAAAASVTDQRSFYHHAALNAWVLVGLFAVAGAIIVYLYRAQQRVAARRLVITLTAIRVILLVCLLVMLLQPAVRWVHHHSSAGTLWLMLDGTGSMATTDPQSTPVERLRWADALEYLPKEARPVKLDRTVATLVCLRDNLTRVAAMKGSKNDGERYGEAVAAWRQGLGEAIEQLESDARAVPVVSPFVATLRDTLKAAGETSAMWSRIESDLDVAIKTLSPLADLTDGDFLKVHGSEQAVAEALGKVAKLSRSQLALAALTNKPQHGGSSLRDSLPAYRVRIATFTDKVQSTASAEGAELPESIKRSLVTTGQATSLSSGLQWIAEQTSPDEPTSVLVLSDGRQNLEGDPNAAAQQLATQNARVYALAIGSSQVAVDAAVDAVDAPDWVYKDDAVRVSAKIRADGLAGKPLTVEFWRGDAKLNSKQITPAKAQDTQVVTFEDAHPELGVHDYAIRVPELAAEENKENNRQSFRVSVKKDQLKVLLVEEQPRWEYRHLVSYVSRDPRVKLQTALTQPARVQDVSPPAPVKASPTNRKTEAQILPEKKEEWLAFDVIVLGDVAAGELPAEQQKNLASAVKDGGKTLIVVAGQRNMPSSYAGAPLAEVLPVALASDWSPDALAEHSRLGFKVQVTPEGSASILSQFRLDAGENAAAWAAVPAWYWHSEQTQAKPNATVIWSIADAEGTTQPSVVGIGAARRRALLATSALGSGRVMYLSSDQTWRLRQVNGENLQERFWGQVVRWATGNDLPAGGQFARFGADKPRYAEGDAVVVTARLLKEDLTPLAGQAIEVIATEMSGQSPTQPAERRIFAQAKLAEVPDAPGLYRATLSGLAPGEAEIALRGPAVDRLMADVTDPKQRTLRVHVQPQVTVEQRNTNTDKAALAAIAKAGGGIMLDGPYAGVLSRYIPQPKLEQTTVEQLGLFGDPKSRYTRMTHWIFLAIFCLLITAEWSLRKAGGLV